MVTLFAATSTVPPVTAKVCSPPLVRTNTSPAFKVVMSGAWLSKIPMLPSVPGRLTKEASPWNKLASGVKISTVMACYRLSCVNQASANIFSPAAITSSMLPFKLKAASGR